jgi:hypothetical protein
VDYIVGPTTVTHTLDIRGEAGDPKPLVTGPSVNLTFSSPADNSSVSHVALNSTGGQPITSTVPLDLSDVALTGNAGCAALAGGGSIVDSTLRLTGPFGSCLSVSSAALPGPSAPATSVRHVSVKTDVASIVSQPAVTINAPNTTVTDLNLQAAGVGLQSGVSGIPGTGATIRRLVASATGVAVQIGGGSVLTDSLVTTPSGTAISALDGTIRNVTAVSSGGGVALDLPGSIFLGPTAGSVSVRNAILRGATSDVTREPGAGLPGCGPPPAIIPCPAPTALSIGNSNYRTIADTAGSGFTDAGGNITGDPMFVAPGTDYHLKLGSPSIDSGTDDAANGTTDLDGNARKQGSAVDMGAYETKRLETAAALSSSANPATRGEPLTLTATLSKDGSSSEIPTGTVTFTDGGTTIGTGTIGADGVASLTPDLRVGSHDIKASYAGDGKYGPAASGTLTEVVNRQRTKTTVDAFAEHVQVASLGSGAAKPSGDVTVSDGDTVLGTFPLDGDGRAAISPGALSKGVHVIVVDYGGDDNFRGSAAATAITVGGGAPSGPGEPITPLSLAGPKTFSAKPDRKGAFSLKGLVGKCGSSACTFTATESKKLASGKLALTAGKSGTLKLKLTSAGKKALKKKKKLTLTVKVSGRDANGKTVAKTVKVKLKTR